MIAARIGIYLQNLNCLADLFLGTLYRYLSVGYLQGHVVGHILVDVPLLLVMLLSSLLVYLPFVLEVSLLLLQASKLGVGSLELILVVLNDLDRLMP